MVPIALNFTAWDSLNSPRDTNLVSDSSGDLYLFHKLSVMGFLVFSFFSHLTSLPPSSLPFSSPQICSASSCSLHNPRGHVCMQACVHTCPWEGMGEKRWVAILLSVHPYSEGAVLQNPAYCGRGLSELGKALGFLFCSPLHERCEKSQLGFEDFFYRWANSFRVGVLPYLSEQSPSRFGPVIPTFLWALLCS